MMINVVDTIFINWIVRNENENCVGLDYNSRKMSLLRIQLSCIESTFAPMFAGMSVKKQI